MKGFLKNIHSVLLSSQEIEDKDRGDLVQMIIIVAGFAIAAIAIVGWITTALFGVGADSAKCLTTYGQGLMQNDDAWCRPGIGDGNTHAHVSECDIVNNDKAYRSRFDDHIGCSLNNW